MSGRDLALLFGLAAMWGASFMFIKVAVAEMSPLMLVSLRLLLASAVLAPLLRISGLAGGSSLPAPPVRRLWKAYLWIAVINAIVPYTLIAWGEEHIASGTASILNATTPLWTALLAGVALAGRAPAERLTPGRILGLLVGFAGVAVLVAGQGMDVALGLEPAALAGQGAVLVAALAYGVGGLYGRRAFAGIPPAMPATWQTVFGAAILTPVAWALTPLQRVPSPQAILSVVALGMLGTAVALLLYYHLLARVGATRTVMVTYLLPVMALVYGALFLREPVSPSSLAGLALVLAGIAITARARERAVPSVAGRSA